MKTRFVKNAVFIFMGVMLFSSCQNRNGELEKDLLPFYQDASFTPYWELSNEALDTFHKIPDFNLLNQDGHSISASSFEDKIFIVDFFFTICPGICPKMTENMAKLQSEFKNDDEVLFLSHSVTPERDSVPILKAYAEEHGVISGKWHLVTGKQDEIYTLGRKSYFVEESLGEEKEIDEFLHTENFVLIDQNRHIRGIYNGLNKASLNQLSKDIYTLKKGQ